MKPEKQHLLHDLCDGDRRGDTLLAGARILRRRRWKRAATHWAGAAAALALGGVLAENTLTRRALPVTAVAPMVAVAATEPKVHYLTDEELLAMFPNVPVGLAKVGDKERLIFINPDDEKRYVARM
ncbi:MAG: hypothetical protein ABSH19_04565 [Opitutales bacterium]